MFLQKSKYRRLEIEKKNFSAFSFQKFLIFSMCFFKKCSMFRRSIPFGLQEPHSKGKLRFRNQIGDN